MPKIDSEQCDLVVAALQLSVETLKSLIDRYHRLHDGYLAAGTCNCNICLDVDALEVKVKGHLHGGQKQGCNR